MVCVLSEGLDKEETVPSCPCLTCKFKGICTSLIWQAMKFWFQLCPLSSDNSFMTLFIWNPIKVSLFDITLMNSSWDGIAVSEDTRRASNQKSSEYKEKEKCSVNVQRGERSTRPYRFMMRLSFFEESYVFHYTLHGFKTQWLNTSPEPTPHHHFMMDLKCGKHTLMPQGRKVLTRLKSLLIKSLLFWGLSSPRDTSNVKSLAQETPCCNACCRMNAYELFLSALTGALKIIHPLPNANLLVV